MSLKIPGKSQEILEVVTRYFSELVDVYLRLGPTADTFIEVMRKNK